MANDKKRYVTTWVRAEMEPIMEEKTVKKQVGTKVVQQRKHIFSKETVEVEKPVMDKQKELQHTGKYSDTHINIDAYSDRIEDRCNYLDENGYDVISITPVTKGNYHWRTVGGQSNAGYGYGYGVTDGVVIVGKLRGSANRER